MLKSFASTAVHEDIYIYIYIRIYTRLRFYLYHLVFRWVLQIPKFFPVLPCPA